jgi:hypothetical protein
VFSVFVDEFRVPKRRNVFFVAGQPRFFVAYQAFIFFMGWVVPEKR